MRFFVVGLELEELLERPDRGLWLLPFELERRELLCGCDELTVGLLALPIDPRRIQVGEKFSAVHRDRGSQVLHRLARSSGLSRFATAAQRPQEDFEIHMDRDREGEPISGVCAYDARGL